MITQNVRKQISESVKKLWKNPDYRKRISEGVKKLWQDPVYREKACRGRSGRLVSQETREKISRILLGKKKAPFSLEHRHKLSLAKKGKSHPPPSIETRKKIAFAQKGEKSHQWRGGKTEINKIIHGSIEYRLWREAVFARDNWTCQKCLIKGGRLAPHHIRNFSEWPDVRFAIDNGITFCTNCHILFHKIYGRKNNNALQIQLFLSMKDGAKSSQNDTKDRQ